MRSLSSLLLLSFFCQAQTPDLSQIGAAPSAPLPRLYKGKEDRGIYEQMHPAISEKYFRGNYLIYDCEEHHFVCVDEKNFQDCKKRREYAHAQGKSGTSCAPFKMYSSYTLCIKKQYELMHSGGPRVYCSDPDFH